MNTLIESTFLHKLFTFETVRGMRASYIWAVACVMCVSYQSDALASRPLPPWPLDCEFSPQGEEIVDVPVSYVLAIRKSKLNDYGAIVKIDITMSLERGLTYNGPVEWNFDFKDMDEANVPMEFVMKKADTAGFTLNFRVYLEDGKIWPQPFQRFFLSSESQTYQTVSYIPEQLAPEVWIRRHGTQEQKDSARAAKWKLEAEEYAKKGALKHKENYESKAYASKLLPSWPLTCMLAPQGEEIAGAPVLYELTMRAAWSEIHGPIDKIEIKMSLERELTYTGPLEWSYDFKEKSELTIPLEFVVNKSDTAGFVMDLKVYLENGKTINQPFQRYFLSTETASYTVVNYEPPQLAPGVWIRRHGTQEQKDSARAARWMREAEEYAKKKALELEQPYEGKDPYITYSQGGDSARIERVRNHYLREAIQKESAPLRGKPHEVYEIGNVWLARLEGEREFRFWKPFSSSELNDLAEKRINPSYSDRFLDSVTIYLALGSDSSLASAREFVSDLYPTDVDSLFKTTVSVEQFKVIVHNQFKFETRLSGFESRPAIVPYDPALRGPDTSD